MTVDPEQCAEILERLEPLGDVVGKRMFSGYGYWESGTMFALITSTGRLHFKTDEQTQASYTAAGAERFIVERAGGRSMETSYWQVPADVLADDDRFDEWARTAMGVAHAAKAGAKPRRRKRSDKGGG